jgi:hypothetical protein
MIATKTFALAGNATFTITSKRTGTRFTYKIEAADDGRCHFVKLLTGPDNWSNYSYFGTIRNGQFNLGNPQSVKVSADAPSVKGFGFFWKHIDGQPFEHIPSKTTITIADLFEVHHEGKCCRCGRKLTVPSSVESGVGPECAALMGL